MRDSLACGVSYGRVFVLGTGDALGLVREVVKIGYGGCDIFLFLSGFGLAFSLAKEKSFSHYIGRRAKRIFPAYYPFICVYMAAISLKSAEGITIPQIFGNLTFLGFWRDLENQFNWYIQAAMVFYLLAPAIGWVFKKMGSGWKSLILLAAISGAINAVYWGQNSMIAVTRLPVFIIGFYLGTLEPGKTVWTKTKITALIGAFLLGAFCLKAVNPYITWGNGLYWYPFILIAPAGALLVAACRPYYLRCRLLYYLDKAVCLLGICSYEIYLIHALIVKWRNTMTGNQQWCLLSLACIAGGIGYHYLVEYVVKNWNVWRKKAA